MLDALKRNRVYINCRLLLTVAGCNGGSDSYNLRERPIEPQAEAPFCKQCHIVTSKFKQELEPAYYDKIPMHHLEKTSLNNEHVSFAKNPTSRFACVVVLEKWMDEMPISIGSSVSDRGNLTPEWWMNTRMHPRQYTHTHGYKR